MHLDRHSMTLVLTVKDIVGELSKTIHQQYRIVIYKLLPDSSSEGINSIVQMCCINRSIKTFSICYEAAAALHFRLYSLSEVALTAFTYATDFLSDINYYICYNDIDTYMYFLDMVKHITSSYQKQIIRRARYFCSHVRLL